MVLKRTRRDKKLPGSSSIHVEPGLEGSQDLTGNTRAVPGFLVSAGFLGTSPLWFCVALDHQLELGEEYVIGGLYFGRVG